MLVNIDYKVTDVFQLTIIEGKIQSVANSSDDPDIYYEAKKWVKINRPELVVKQCEGIWDGGPTPCECIKGTIEGFREFVKNRA